MAEVRYGEILLPYRLTADGAGVELRGEYACQYQGVPENAIAEVQTRIATRKAEVAHCEKLLRELPIALKNCEAAAIDEAKSDFNEIGPLAVEQRCISRRSKYRPRSCRAASTSARSKK